MKYSFNVSTSDISGKNNLRDCNDIHICEGYQVGGSNSAIMFIVFSSAEPMVFRSHIGLYDACLNNVFFWPP